MAASESESPKVDVEVLLDPSTHSFSQESPPTLTLRLTSHAETSITFFTWNSPLDPRGALTNNGFVITDTDSGQIVQTASLMVNRSALKRTRGTSDEQYFLTLQPKTPVEISIGFGRRGGGIKPLPKSIVERGRELDEHGNEMDIRRSRFATGVDGLEPDHQYTVGLNMDALRRTRWAPVPRDEILLDHSGEGSYVQDYLWEAAPAGFNIRETTLNVEG